MSAPRNRAYSNCKYIYSGLIRLHVLHHASEKAIREAWIIEELKHHGYALSPGTLYLLLQVMEREGYLRSHDVQWGGRKLQHYSATSNGRAALAEAKNQVSEFFGDLFETAD